MGRSKGHVPIRQCIACGRKGPKNELIRLVLNDARQVTQDSAGVMPGRGAYVCRRDVCMEKLSGKKRLKKAFRTEVISDRSYKCHKLYMNNVSVPASD